MQSFLKYELILPQKCKISCEKDLYRVLKNKVFEKCFKVYSFVLRGFPDFIVVKTKVDQLTPGFYEVKYSNKISSLTENQAKLLKVLSESFDVYVVLYDKKEHKIKFLQIKES